MTLAQLRYLLAIVDAGMNITVAAERVNATQPGLSKQLKGLEEELALRLFVRRSRNLERLTPAGEEIVRRARVMVAEAENIRVFAANQRTAHNGSLHIETTHTQALYVLPEALAAMRKQFPAVDVTLGFGADADDAEQRFHGADLRLFSSGGARPAGEIAIPLYHWEPIAVVRPDHPIVRRPGPVTLEELAQYSLITYDNSRTAPLSIAKTFLDAGLSPRFAFTARDSTLIKASVRGGAGIGLLAEMAADPIADHDLRVVPLAGLLPRCTTWAVLRRDCVLRDYLIHLLGSLSGLTPLMIRRAVAGELAPEGVFANVRRWSDAIAATERPRTLQGVANGPASLRPALSPAPLNGAASARNAVVRQRFG